jgi:hypothetical protein
MTPYWAAIRGRRYVVRAAEDDEEGTADFGRFSLAMWTAEDGHPRYRAQAQSVQGPVDEDEERACWGLLARLGDENAPRACFFCRWSDVEPSTGWGHLGCGVALAEDFHRRATSPDPRTRKWISCGLDWVDEWHSCERFEVRPQGYGYRGRPR